MILFIGENIKSHSGGGVATRSNLLRLSKELKEEIEIYDVFKPPNTIIEKITNIMFGCTKPFALLRKIQGSKFRLIWIDRSTLAWIRVFYICNKRIKWRIFMHNNERLYHLDLFKLRPTISGFFRFIAVSFVETLITSRLFEVYSINPLDKKRFKKLKILLPIFKASTILDSEEPKSEIGNYFLVIGSNFSPNIQGMKWLINKVCPVVDKEFLFVGKNLNMVFNNLTLPSNVNIVDSPINTQPYYENCIATISPITFGSGLKIKIAETIFFGKHCYSTPISANPFKEILESEFEKYITIFNKSEELIKHLNQHKINKLNKYSYFNEK